jgi:hypothetical protein
LLPIRSVLSEEKKLSIAALSQTFAGPAHRTDDAIVGHQTLELLARILAALVTRPSDISARLSSNERSD